MFLTKCFVEVCFPFLPYLYTPSIRPKHVATKIRRDHVYFSSLSTTFSLTVNMFAAGGEGLIGDGCKLPARRFAAIPDLTLISSVNQCCIQQQSNGNSTLSGSLFWKPENGLSMCESHLPAIAKKQVYNMLL